MKKVLYITGCLGFMGSYFTRACLNLGWYIIGVDRITYAAHPEFLDEFNKYKNFKFIKEDINNLDYFFDCDYFVNFAASTHVDNSISSSKEFLYSNINGVYNILENLRRMSYSRKLPILISISTDETYADIKDGAHKETDLLKPSNPYSSSKACGDLLILAWARTYNIPYVIIRPTNNYGLFQNNEKLIPRACKHLFLGKKIELHNQGTPIRNWLHASDTAEAILTIINSKSKNEIFNVAGGFEQSNIVTAQKIINCFLNRDINIELTKEEKEKYIDFNSNRRGQDFRYAIDDSKLRALGWSPKKKFDEELPKIVEYYKNNFVW